MKRINDERGMASIMVASVVMIVMSLITIGFARLMSRENRQSIDRQLSTQAFYAAESAINDARSALAAGETAEKASCDVETDNPYVGTDDGLIDAAQNIRYTCLTVNSAVASLEYDNGVVNENTPRIGRVESASGEVIDRITFAWEGTTASQTAYGTCGAPFNNTTLGAWGANRPALLRVDIIPANVLLRNVLLDRTRSIYLYPCAGGGPNISIASVASHGSNQFNGGCVTGRAPRDCLISISGLAAAYGSGRYYVRLSTYYKAANVTVRATNAAGTLLTLRNGQIQIDATGRSNDVLRRIVARVPAADDQGITNAVVSSIDSFCKTAALTRNAGAVLVVPGSDTCP